MIPWNMLRMSEVVMVEDTGSGRGRGEGEVSVLDSCGIYCPSKHWRKRDKEVRPCLYQCPKCRVPMDDWSELGMGLQYVVWNWIRTGMTRQLALRGRARGCQWIGTRGGRMGRPCASMGKLAGGGGAARRGAGAAARALR
eukprot:gene14515-biopygen9160